MKAINNYIIIENIKEEPKKTNGLIISDNHTKDIRYLKGRVISFGNLTEGLKKDDVIYYDRHAGHNIEFEEKLYQVIRQGDVVLVL